MSGNEATSAIATPSRRTGLDMLPRQRSRHMVAFDLSDVVRRAWHGHVNEHRQEPERAAPTALRNLARVLRGRQPTHALCAGEGIGSLREGIFSGYKAGRPEKPAGLLRCQAQVEQALTAAGIAHIRVAGLEADDVLAGAVLVAKPHGLPVVIATRDKDAEVLVSDEWRVLVWRDGEEVLDEAAVVKRWGVQAHRVSELLAIMGDSTDNVPGAKGLGKVAAARILNAAVREHLSVLLRDGGTPWIPKMFRSKWLASREMIAVSWELTRLRGEEAARRIHFDDLELDPLTVAESLINSAEYAARNSNDDDRGGW